MTAKYFVLTLHRAALPFVIRNLRLKGFSVRVLVAYVGGANQITTDVHAVGHQSAQQSFVYDDKYFIVTERLVVRKDKD